MITDRIGLHTVLLPLHSKVIIYKQSARRLSLYCANLSSTLSTLISFSSWMCNIGNDERRSSAIVFRSGVFNLFIQSRSQRPRSSWSVTGIASSGLNLWPDGILSPQITDFRLHCAESTVNTNVIMKVE